MADTNDLRNSMESAASQAGERIKQATSAATSKAQDLAGAARGAAAESLEQTRRYIQEEGVKGMVEDVAELIRRNPIPAMLVGVGIGFLLAKITRR